jgi:hypothetical protein
LSVSAPAVGTPLEREGENSGGCPVDDGALAADKDVAISSNPRTAVATFGTAYGDRNPLAAGCGAEAPDEPG